MKRRHTLQLVSAVAGFLLLLTLSACAASPIGVDRTAASQVAAATRTVNLASVQLQPAPSELTTATLPEDSGPTGASSPDLGIHFPRQEAPEGERETMDALLYGELVLVGDCLHVYDHHSGTRYVPVWPPGYRLDADGDTIQILDGGGQVVARVGDRLRLDGGEVWSDGVLDENVRKALAANCPGPFWIIGQEVAPAEVLPPASAPVPSPTPRLPVQPSPEPTRCLSVEAWRPSSGSTQEIHDLSALPHTVPFPVGLPAYLPKDVVFHRALYTAHEDGTHDLSIYYQPIDPPSDGRGAHVIVRHSYSGQSMVQYLRSRLINACTLTQVAVGDAQGYTFWVRGDRRSALIWQQGDLKTSIWLVLNDVQPSQSNPHVLDELLHEIANSMKPTERSDAVDISRWQAFRDQERGYEIKYPHDWRVQVFDGWVGFSPRELREDVRWAIRTYSSQDQTIEEVIAEIGQQFGSHRTETRQQVNINGLPALEVVVTTSKIPDWHAVSIILDYEGTVLQISNGAVRDDRFEAFYTSFKLTAGE